MTRCSPPSSNGANILIAGADGSVMIYDATASTFTVSRKDFSSARRIACGFELQSIRRRQQSARCLGCSADRAAALPPVILPVSRFVDQGGYFTTAPNSSAPGVIEQVNLNTGTGIQPTSMVEAPILSPTGLPAPPTNSRPAQPPRLAPPRCRLAPRPTARFISQHADLHARRLAAPR